MPSNATAAFLPSNCHFICFTLDPILPILVAELDSSLRFENMLLHTLQPSFPQRLNHMVTDAYDFGRLGVGAFR